jgi:hypothetical protein
MTLKTSNKKNFLAQCSQTDYCCNNTIIKKEQAENPKQE